MWASSVETVELPRLTCISESVSAGGGTPSPGQTAARGCGVVAGPARQKFHEHPLKDGFKYYPSLATRRRGILNLEKNRLLGWVWKREVWKGAVCSRPVGQRCHTSIGGKSAGVGGERTFDPVQKQSSDHASSNSLPFCTVLRGRVRYCAGQGLSC